MPVTNQATSSQPALPICRDMSADTMKIPEPIITPTTTITESNRPSPRAKVGPEGETEGVPEEATGASVVINILVVRAALRPAPRGCTKTLQVSPWRREVCVRRLEPRINSLDAWI